MAQIIESVRRPSYPYELPHFALVSSLRSTESSTSGGEPPLEVTPHPATVAVVSAPL